MANTPKSFEEFYYEAQGEVLGIELVADYADANDGDIAPYKGQMLCPECTKAELSFVHETSKRRAHLRRKQGSAHEETCSYNYEYASREQVREYIDSLSYDEVQDLLGLVIRRMCETPANAVGSGKSKEAAGHNPMLIKASNDDGKTSTLRQLRRKRLDAWVNEDELEVIFVFYGKAKLKALERTKKGTESEKYNVLEVYRQNKEGEWIFRTSLWRRKLEDVDENAVYNFAMVGHADSRRKWQIKMSNNDAVAYKKIESLL